MHPYPNSHRWIERGMIALFLILAFAAGCTPSAPLPTQMSASTPTPLPFPTISSSPTSTPTPLPTETNLPAPERPTYTFDVTWDFDVHTVAVDETIVYPNRTGQPLTSLALAVQPNVWPEGFTLESFTIDDSLAANYTLEGRRMTLALPRELLPGQAVQLSLRYQLALPVIEYVDPTIAGPRIFGYTDLEQNLANWYPFIVPFVDGQWVLHEPSFQGEFLVYDAADFDVTLRFADPSSAPVVAASGWAEPGSESGEMRYSLRSARTFVLSASRSFQVEQVQVGEAMIYVYYFPFDHERELEVRAVSNTVARSVEIFSETFGAYPHKSLTFVLADFPGSMEYSAFIFYGRGPDVYFDGTPNNEYVALAAHETSHQWWFDQVGNDPALHPWLDETLSTYSEHIYYESASPSSVDHWWWPFRVDMYNPGGYVDATIYEQLAYRPYVNAVYFQGAYFLEKARGRMGRETFFAFLRDYYSQQQGKIAVPADFFSLLRQHSTVDMSDLIAQYFKGTY